ncbi:MAG: phospholipase D family protein [Blastocatellia bacterium]|nr:phospholipase D family protein [Blastocatellia bacterium]
MSSRFIHEDVWKELTAAVRNSKLACHIAVAYFGAGASRLLPLSEGSTLVVDASERAISAGQTCPDDLQVLLKRGVRIFSIPNLHAKVYVVGRAAYIGSANVSNHSAGRLLEAMLFTTDREAVASARQFVRSLWLHELSPEMVVGLARIYQPPRLPGGSRTAVARKKRSPAPDLPPLLLAQLVREDWSKSDYRVHDTGMSIAKERRKHPRKFEMDSFRCAGRDSYRKGDVVLQVTKENDGRILVSPPGNVLYVHRRKTAKALVSFVYLELPADRRRKPVESLAARLGEEGEKILRRKGLIRNSTIARALLEAWGKS